MAKLSREDNFWLERERIIRQGYLNNKDIQTFVPCGYQSARRIIEKVTNNLAKDKKSIYMFGIPSKAFLEEMKMTSSDVYKSADDERKKATHSPAS